MLQEPAHCPKDINMCETSVRFKPGTPVGIWTKKAKDRMRFFSFALFLIERVPYTACITVLSTILEGAATIGFFLKVNAKDKK